MGKTSIILSIIGLAAFAVGTLILVEVDWRIYIAMMFLMLANNLGRDVTK